MISAKRMRVSIVIPVYNEAEQLGACLDAISAQLVAPYEVIVVDNNSDDGSAAIARRYPFVRLLFEARQGVVHARDCGFSAAQGDIIGRIDADTLIDSDWVATIQELFADAQLDAVSGPVRYYDMPWHKPIGKADAVVRSWVARGMGREVFLFGSNMAVRARSWRAVSEYVCSKPGLHEDFDLAIHLFDNDALVTYDPRLTAGVSARRVNMPFQEFWNYMLCSPRTYAAHNRHSQRRMYGVAWLVLTTYVIMRIVYRCYDPETDKLSVRNLLTSRAATLRVNPATYVD